ncbi:MAG: hypothetical protein GKR93_00380 [Gammaproteobacteria bacterium]|nr:hypothetical protein [Gammaproteobacteria bacterium]
MQKHKLSRILFGLTVSLLPGLVFAHHPNGYQLPASMMEGLLSGLGHPVIGPEHLAFIIGIGILAHALRQRILIPAVFITSALLGTILHLNKINIPQVEAMIAISVALLGLILFCNWLKKPAAIALALGGILHGYAYAESIVGAETTPLVAYLTGSSLVQLLICGLVILICQAINKSKRLSINPLSKVYGLIAVFGGAYLLV